MIRSSQDLAFIWISQGKLDTVKEFLGKQYLVWWYLLSLGHLSSLRHSHSSWSGSTHKKQNKKQNRDNISQIVVKIKWNYVYERVRQLEKPSIMLLLCFRGTDKERGWGDSVVSWWELWLCHQVAWVLTSALSLTGKSLNAWSLIYLICKMGITNSTWTGVRLKAKMSNIWENFATTEALYKCEELQIWLLLLWSPFYGIEIQLLQ